LASSTIPRTTSASASRLVGSLAASSCASAPAGAPAPNRARAASPALRRTPQHGENARHRRLRLETNDLMLDGMDGKPSPLGGGRDIVERVRITPLPAQGPVTIAGHGAIEMRQQFLGREDEPATGLQRGVRR